MSRVTKMSAPLPQTNSDQMALPWMSSAEASPAKTSHTQGGGQAWKAQDQDYGAKSPAWLASYDRNTSLWKTSQHSLVEGLDEFSETWPRSGTTRNGIAYQLPPLALRTDATGFGSWPTPRANSAMAATITPESSWADNRFPNLETMVGRMMWPTPKSRDWKDGASAGTFQRSSPDLGKVVGQSTTTGALNPTWVEWLMGFPLGWTVSKAWETRSSRKSLKSLAGQS